MLVVHMGFPRIMDVGTLAVEFTVFAKLIMRRESLCRAVPPRRRLQVLLLRRRQIRAAVVVALPEALVAVPVAPVSRRLPGAVLPVVCRRVVRVVRALLAIAGREAALRAVVCRRQNRGIPRFPVSPRKLLT